jgi:hypothetical protein
MDKFINLFIKIYVINVLIIFLFLSCILHKECNFILVIGLKVYQYFFQYFTSIFLLFKCIFIFDNRNNIQMIDLKMIFDLMNCFIIEFRL